ncbi:hypothetical protein ANN_06426 [Periplaneta americana]|uniref:Uncharacterized protein n=1 Tax=Periplaneta americana TaxID=6978 RepID=A0ABQ8TG09_PERAM|nr:hypothetical protein ANN_06426 [Periplaneta americana]
MASLCEGGNEPAGSLKAIYEDMDYDIENESDDESNREVLLNEVQDSNSEPDDDDDDDDERLISINDGNCYTGRNKTTIWQEVPVAQCGRRRAQNKASDSFTGP